jgi:delta 1-pyrroline-5-carboxylate dehydrogenase
LSALLCGNRVQIVGASPDWASHFSGMGQITCQPELAPALVDAVAVFGDAPLQKQLQQLLAHSDGKIIPLMTRLGDWACLVHERHVCTDTTAAGGNADLLANSD